MANLTNPDNWVSVEQLDYFAGKMNAVLVDIVESIEFDEETGDITITYDDGTEEEESEEEQ